MDSATPAALYKRKSRDPRNLASIEDQDRLGRADISEQGWDLTAVLDDAGRSASRYATRDRPDWDKLLGMIEAGQVRAVWLWESNRGDRELESWARFLNLCRKHGVLIRVYTHEYTYDVRRARDWKTLAEEGVNNAHFSDQLSAVVRRGITGAAMRGEPYGPVSFGYRAVYSPDTGKRTGWEIVPENAGHVRHVIAWIGSHKPVTALRKDLHDRGVLSPSGKEWWDEAYVRDVARNPVYAALRRLPDGTLVDGKWPEIVTRQQHLDAVAALDGRKPMSRPGKQKHLCSYLATCGECSAPFAVYRREDRMYYRCRQGCFSVRYEWLDDVVSFVVIARFSRPDAREVFRVDDIRSAAVADELATLKARLESFTDSAADGHVTAPALAKIEAKLNPQITAKQAELDRLTIPPAMRKILGAADVAQVWEDMIVQERRALLGAALESVTVNRPPRLWRSMVLPHPSDPGDLVKWEWKRG